jgi:hypothetical protein
MPLIHTLGTPQCRQMDFALCYGDKIIRSMGNNGVPTLSSTSGKSGEDNQQLVFHKYRAVAKPVNVPAPAHGLVVLERESGI